MQVKDAINELNNKRKQRLMLLLEHIEDQGQREQIKFFFCFTFRLKKPENEQH